MRNNIRFDDIVAGLGVLTSNGWLTIIDKVDRGHIKIRFNSTGYERSIPIDHLNTGKIKDMYKPKICGFGCIGDGDYVCRVEGKTKTLHYTLWENMISRCYSESSLKNYPTYRGCTVCDEWRNFQVFAKWVDENYPNDGKRYQLDKDNKVKGNTCYSPDTCVFLTHAENSAVSLAGNFVLTSPEGEKVDIFNLRKFCRDNNLSNPCVRQVLRGVQRQHKGWTRYGE